MRTNKDKAITKIECAKQCIFSNPKLARDFLDYAIDYLKKGNEEP